VANWARTLVKTGLNGAIERFQLNMHRWPRRLEELANKPSDPTEAGRWVGPYIYPEQLRDPFGAEWRYTSPGEHDPNGYDLSSAGLDRQWGTADDLTNWASTADAGHGVGSTWIDARLPIACGLGVLMAAGLLLARRVRRG
jgi:general secretion pathway protein G